jgi:hypothetical protein
MGVFAVTAYHVVEECFADSKLPTFVQTMIGGRLGRPAPFYLAGRIIDAHHDLDVAKFRITPEELKLTGHTVLTSFQKAWPPRFPEVNAGITFCGFPAHSLRVPSFHEIVFGIFSAACNLTSANEDFISVLIERERLVQVHGDGVLSEDYDFGGSAADLSLQSFRRRPSGLGFLPVSLFRVQILPAISRSRFRDSK